jgi:hypothetical protein
MRVQGNLPLGIPGAEMPKHQTLTRLYHFGVSQVGISRRAKTRKLALGFPGCQNSETPKLIHVRLFRVSWVKSSELLPLVFPVTELPKSPFGDFPETSTACIFRDFGVCDFANPPRPNSWSFNLPVSETPMGSDLCHVSSEMDGPDLFGTLTSPHLCVCEA